MEFDVSAQYNYTRMYNEFRPVKFRDQITSVPLSEIFARDKRISELEAQIGKCVVELEFQLITFQDKYKIR